MSRLFDAAVITEQIVTPQSPVYNNLAAITVAGWIKPSSTGGNDFGILWVKDPNSAYSNYVAFKGDGSTQLVFAAGGPSTTGEPNGISLGNGGNGYALNDFGTISGGNGLAEYTVNNVLSNPGPVGAVGLKPGSHDGAGYSVGSGVATTAETGTGAGLTVNIDTISPNVFASQGVTNESITLDDWTHIALTWSVGNAAKLYINGVEATYETTPQSTDGVPEDSGDGWYFGNDGQTDAFDGSLAEIAVYDRVLSDAEILALAQSTSGASGSPVGYWHLCGEDSPEPDASGNGNDGVLSDPPPEQSEDSPGYSCVSPTAPTQFTIGVGEFGGQSLAEAFFNPDAMDILQVVNEGGDIVWNLAADGTTTVEPTSPTKDALLGRYEGESFQLAFPNPYGYDVLQIIGQGDSVVFWVNSNGAGFSI